MPTWISEWWSRVRGKETEDPITDAVAELQRAEAQLEEVKELQADMQNRATEIEERVVENHFGESIKFVWGLP